MHLRYVEWLAGNSQIAILLFYSIKCATLYFLLKQLYLLVCGTLKNVNQKLISYLLKEYRSIILL